MNAVSYVINAMRLLPLCWIAANALRDLCDANRVALAPHINSFAELYAGLTGIPVCFYFDPYYYACLITC
jgi:hypothetical protein